MRIEVDLDTIKCGKPRDGYHCPIASALRQAGFICPRVGFTDARAGFNNDVFSFDLPPDAVKFIRAYDAGDPVAPFWFTLTLPEQSQAVTHGG